MTMKCNMCNEANMIWTPVLYHENLDTVFVISEEGTPEIMDELKQFYAIKNRKSDLFKGMRIVHVFNCEECVNSQLEYYIADDAIAFEMAMNAKTRKEL